MLSYSAELAGSVALSADLMVCELLTLRKMMPALVPKLRLVRDPTQARRTSNPPHAQVAAPQLMMLQPTETESDRAPRSHS
jgi:hypothetical protein